MKCYLNSSWIKEKVFNHSIQLTCQKLSKVLEKPDSEVCCWLYGFVCSCYCSKRLRKGIWTIVFPKQSIHVLNLMCFMTYVCSIWSRVVKSRASQLDGFSQGKPSQRKWIRNFRFKIILVLCDILGKENASAHNTLFWRSLLEIWRRSSPKHSPKRLAFLC